MGGGDRRAAGSGQPGPPLTRRWTIATQPPRGAQERRADTSGRRAAANPKTTYCLTVADDQGHAIGHGCARTGPRNQRGTAKRSRPGSPGDHDPPGGPSSQPGPGFTFTASDQHGPRGGYGVWRLATGVPEARDLRTALEPIATEECDHLWEGRGHEPGVMLRHLSQIRHATCTGPTCRRLSQHCDFEHNIPYEAGGRTCMCNLAPLCRHHHRCKQAEGWRLEQPAPGVLTWRTPSGRTFTTTPTEYPL